MGLYRGWCEILAMLGLPSSSHMAYMSVVIDIRPRKLWKSKISRTPENALHFHEGLPPRSQCLFISDLAHKLMATFNFAPTSVLRSLKLQIIQWAFYTKHFICCDVQINHGSIRAAVTKQ